MHIIFLGNITDSVGQDLLRIIESVVPKDNIKIFQTVTALNKNLRHVHSKPAAALLCPADAKELEELIRLKGLLNDIPIILVLPDRFPKSIALGHKLYPRLLSYSDTKFRDVKAVLEKYLTGPDVQEG